MLAVDGSVGRGRDLPGVIDSMYQAASEFAGAKGEYRIEATPSGIQSYYLEILRSQIFSPKLT